MTYYNFDTVIDRRESGAIKCDTLKERFGRDDVIAAWVADMDFATPPFIMEAIKKRLEHPILGYTEEPSDYRPSIINWEKELHNWEIKPEWISFIPGIVKGIGMVINVFTKPGDNVVIMPPIYHPFRNVTILNGRNAVEVPLISDSNGKYQMDFEKLESLQISGGVLLLSNPHNPGGTMWNRSDLQRLAGICRRKKLLVVSDEIHADMALWGKRHIPFATVSDDAASNSITFCAPSKTFNIPGIVSSFSVIPDEGIRQKFYGWLEASEFNSAPMLSPIATIAAYRQGKVWRDEMLRYMEGNVELIIDYCQKEIKPIKALKPDASFLVWLDCRGLGLNQHELMDLFVNQARVAVNDGEMFGKEGKGFVRLNVATPRTVVMEILKRIKEAVLRLKTERPYGKDNRHN